MSCTRPGSRTCSETVSKLSSQHSQRSHKLILQNKNVLFRWRHPGDGGFHPSVCKEASVQRPVTTEERLSHHGQRWLHEGLQRDVSAASTFIPYCFLAIDLPLTILLFVQDAISAGVKHLG